MASKLEYLPHEPGKPDPWFRHTAAEGAPQAEHAGHVNPTALIISLVLIVGTTLAIMVAVGGYYMKSVADLRREREAAADVAAVFEQYRDNTQLELTTLGWVGDQIQIPIEQAKGIVVQRYSQSH